MTICMCLVFCKDGISDYQFIDMNYTQGIVAYVATMKSAKASSTVIQLSARIDIWRDYSRLEVKRMAQGAIKGLYEARLPAVAQLLVRHNACRQSKRSI